MLANKLIDPTIHRPLEILKDCQGCADECPLLAGERRKTYARIELFSF
jgi:hypothetical protein